MVKAIGTLHEKLVFRRRVRVLASHLAALIPPRSRVLDVGCGDGTIAQIISGEVLDTKIEGIDVLVRPTTRIPVRPFDGLTIPYADDSFDVVMFVDVLHHTPNPLVLLREATRVAEITVIKDHYCEGFFAATTLRFMDWVGNAPHGVVLPYNYWPKQRWDAAFVSLGMVSIEMNSRLGLYPAPASWLFERGLHFIGSFTRSHGRDGQ